MKPPKYVIVKDGASIDGTIQGYGVADKDGILCNPAPFEYRNQAVAFRKAMLEDWRAARENAEMQPGLRA